MIELYTILIFGCCFMAYKTEKNLFNPVTIFTFLWAIIFYLSSLRFYTLYSAKIETYNMLLLGILFFVLGYYINKLLSKGNGFKIIWGKSTNNTSNLRINYYACYFSAFLILGYAFYQIKKMGLMAIGFNLKNVSEAVSESTSNTGFINMISFLFVNPLIIPILIITCLDFWYGKRDKILFILTILIILARILVSGGRSTIILFSIAFITSVFLKNDKTKIINRFNISNILNKLKIIVLIIIAISIFILFSLTKTNHLLKTIYLDFAMQPYMFEYWSEEIQPNYSYGFASTFGIIHPFLYIIKNLFGLSNIPTFFNIIYSNIQNTFNTWTEIGTILKANAYTSIFWYLFYDGRIFGIALGMFLLGIISYNLFKRVNVHKNYSSLGNYIFLLILLIYSFTDMELFKASYFLGIIYFNNFILKKTKRKDKINGNNKEIHS